MPCCRHTLFSVVGHTLSFFAASLRLYLKYLCRVSSEIDFLLLVPPVFLAPPGGEVLRVGGLTAGVAAGAAAMAGEDFFLFLPASSSPPPMSATCASPLLSSEPTLWMGRAPSAGKPEGML